MQKEKPIPYQIRYLQEAKEILERADATNSKVGQYIIKLLSGPSDRAQRRIDKPKPSLKEDDWKKARDAADLAFSQYIRFRDTKGGKTLGDRHGFCNTCKQYKIGTDLQCCHWLSRKHFGTRWNEINCAAGCWGCNSKMMGNGRPEDFERYIILTYGREWPDKLRAKAKFEARKPLISDLDAITSSFQIKLEKLKAKEALNV